MLTEDIAICQYCHCLHLNDRFLLFVHTEMQCLLIIIIKIKKLQFIHHLMTI